MRTILHLSDLHFGRVDPLIPPVLAAAAREARPDLIVVSGDFTQRARVREFEDAARFLAELPAPLLMVPGNHDVPLYDVARRWLAPLNRYRRYIAHDLAPVHADAEMVVVGVNTARALTFKNGRVNSAQVALVEERLAAHAGEGSTPEVFRPEVFRPEVFRPEVFRIVVTHHPFDTGEREENIVGRAGMAMARFLASDVDMILSGHLHVSQVHSSVARHPPAEGESQGKENGFLLIQAGTATSTRGRGETNAYNVIRLDHPDAAVTPMLWNPARTCFEAAATARWRKTETGWSRVEGA